MENSEKKWVHLEGRGLALSLDRVIWVERVSVVSDNILKPDEHGILLKTGYSKNCAITLSYPEEGARDADFSLIIKSLGVRSGENGH